MADKIELQRRYQQHALALSDSMVEARSAMAALEKTDMEPDATIVRIDEILQMLGTAHYHAHRLKVYNRLMGHPAAQPLHPNCTIDHGLDSDGNPFGHGTGLFCNDKQTG